jgi:hypothetical protein
VQALAQSSGLSVAGVERGLSHHLEYDATDDELDDLCARVRPVPHVTVVLSSNVFVAGFRAVAVALAAAPSVTVRPSRREPVFIEALLDEARRRGTPRLWQRVTVQRGLEFSNVLAPGALHVYGTAETLAEAERKVPAGVEIVGHGPGMGVALVTGQDADADALADDVVAFDQRGCLSPRIVWLEGDEAAAVRFGRRLSAALERREMTLPRGQLFPDERSAARRYEDTLAAVGTVLRGATYAIGIAGEEGSVVLPPPGRHMHLAWKRGLAPDAALAHWRPLVTIVGFGNAVPMDHPFVDAVATPEARRVPLGRMQRPPFDGPVDLRARSLKVSSGRGAG